MHRDEARAYTPSGGCLKIRTLLLGKLVRRLELRGLGFGGLHPIFEHLPSPEGSGEPSGRTSREHAVAAVGMGSSPAFTVRFSFTDAYPYL